MLKALHSPWEQRGTRSWEHRWWTSLLSQQRQQLPAEPQVSRRREQGHPGCISNPTVPSARGCLPQQSTVGTHQQCRGLLWALGNISNSILRRTWALLFPSQANALGQIKGGFYENREFEFPLCIWINACNFKRRCGIIICLFRLENQNLCWLLRVLMSCHYPHKHFKSSSYLSTCWFYTSQN